MKASTHLFYGIIIGVLATLCMGLNKEEGKQFKEIRAVKWVGRSPISPDERGVDGFYEFERWGDQWDLVIKTNHSTPNEIIKAGWTIIDFEGLGTSKYYLIGK